MGQARRRGTFEERKAQAIKREEDQLAAIREKSSLRNRQEIDAYDSMIWWQVEMSEDRHAMIMRAKQETQLEWASLMGMIYGLGWDSFSGLMSR